MLKSISIARYLIIGLRIPKKHAHPASHWICGVCFYIAIPIARIQAPLRQGFGIPSGNVRVHSKDFYGHERGGLKTGRKMSAERGILVFKSLIIKDSDY